MQSRITPRRQELEALYRARLGVFVRVAGAIVGDTERGADAVQDAFARALASLGRFEGRGSLEAWVWRIVVNSAKREAQRRTADELPETLAATNGHGGDADRVRAAVRQLSERQRQVLFLRYYADLDHRQIAEALGVRRGTVAATIHQAQARLRERLEQP